jgi:putative transposase
MIEYSKNKSVSRNDLNYFLTELKEQESWLYSYHSKMLQMISTQIDGAQKALKQLHENGKNTGSLKFKKYGEYRTFTYNQSGFKIEDGFLYLSKIGKTKIIQHRSLPENAQITQVIVSKSKSEKWYCSITCNVDMDLPKISLTKSVGIDVGIKNLVYDSDGFVTKNPLNLQKLLKPLIRVQRKISRRKKHSNNRKKAVKFYRVIHERIKNRRKDFLHKLSTHYAKKYDVVFVERLSKLNMIKNHSLAQRILDSGWGTFTNMLDYKCMLVEVPAKNTTINCSKCTNPVPKSLASRIHKCNVCGLILDRDHNAAINILNKGLEIFNIKLPQELRKVTPVEISLRSMKQECLPYLFGSGSHKRWGTN